MEDNDDFTPDAGADAPPSAAPAWAGGASPHNLFAEEALLGGIILDPDQFAYIEGMVRPEDFFSPAHAIIFTAMEALRRQAAVIDPGLLQIELETQGKFAAVGGSLGLYKLTDKAASGANTQHYATIVKDMSALRRLIKVSLDAISAASAPGAVVTDILGETENNVRSIVTRSLGGNILSMHEAVQKTWDNIELFMSNKELLNGLSTGFTEMDHMLTGLHDDELIIVAGRPAMGKSTFALNILRSVVTKQHLPAVLFTLEMSAENIVRNMLAAQARVNGQKMRTFNFNDQDRERLDIATDTFNDCPLFIDETPAISLAELRGKARHLKLKNDIRLIVIDYLQLMTASAVARNRSREQEVSEVSRGLKALAKELHVPVIALSQLSRKPEGRQDNRPILSDLRESGAIEQDSDVVLLLHRPSYYDKEDRPGEADVIIAKQRNGPTGDVHLAFFNDELRFENLSPHASFNPGDMG